MSPVVIDSNVLVKLVLPEEDTYIVQELWDHWDDQESERTAPPTMPFECVAAVRWNIVRKTISAPLADTAFQELLPLFDQVRLLAPPEIHERAWEIVKRLQQGQIYDSYYLALAEILDCEFWAADDKFYRSAHTRYPRVKHIRSARRK